MVANNRFQFHACELPNTLGPLSWCETDRYRKPGEPFVRHKRLPRRPRTPRRSRRSSYLRSCKSISPVDSRRLHRGLSSRLSRERELWTTCQPETTSARVLVICEFPLRHERSWLPQCSCGSLCSCSATRLRPAHRPPLRVCPSSCAWGAETKTSLPSELHGHYRRPTKSWSSSPDVSANRFADHTLTP